MRLFVTLLFVFALGTSFSIKGGIASQDKDVKKEEKKEEVKQSLVEKLDSKSVAVLKKILFQDVDKSKISGQESARACAEWLNITEKIIASLEETINTSKDKELISSARRLLKCITEFIGLQSLAWKVRKGSNKLSNLADDSNPGVGYQIGWSSREDQWIVSQIRARFVK